MATNERRALGRGLGSLIPGGDQIVSRETIETREQRSRPTDVFFGQKASGDSEKRRSSSISADLLQPAPRSKRGTAKKSKARASTKGDAVKSASSKGSANAEVTEDGSSVNPATTKASAGANTAAAAKTSSNKAKALKRSTAGAKTNVKPEENNKVAPTGEGTSAKSTRGKKRELFSDIIEGKPAYDFSDNHDEDVREVEIDEHSGSEGLVPIPGVTFAEVDLNLIVPNPRQPREIFDEFELSELAASIREIGVLQPVVVRPVRGTEERFTPIVEERRAQGIEALPQFELVMGERRLRASKLAGLEYIPAIVRATEDDDLLRDALLENLHRTQLNPIEEAHAYQQLMSDFGYTQQELSEKIARSRPQIANSLRLLRLPPSVQRKLAAGVLTAGHARALLGLGSVGQMEVLADRIIAEGLSVRSTEEIVSLGEVTERTAAKKFAKRLAKAPSERAAIVIDRLTDLLDTRVTVLEGKKKGRITIEYAGQEDLERIAEVIQRFQSPAS